MLLLINQNIFTQFFIQQNITKIKIFKIDHATKIITHTTFNNTFLKLIILTFYTSTTIKIFVFMYVLNIDSK